MDDLTPEERAELQWQYFLIREDWIMLELTFLELRLDIIEALDNSIIGRLIRRLASKLDKYSWLRDD